MNNIKSDSSRLPRWYFGGLASAGAAFITHPLDLVKVHLQTQQHGKIGFVGQTVKIVKTEGIFGLFNGLSASLLRQLTYSTTRFAIYGKIKQQISPQGQPISFGQKLLTASFAGAAGNLVGNPWDMVMVRMQNDVKLPMDKRRNYKNVFDGLVRVMREEGVRMLFSGLYWNTARSVMMTVGQLCIYDQIKQMLLETGHFSEGLALYFTASFTAGAISTTMTQPVDVLKTRSMNAKPGQFRTPLHLIKYTAEVDGAKSFYKGFVPRFVRLGPFTVLIFVFYEQLRINFGFDPPVVEKE
eukprot:TRINITY_DN27884_c0_g1_i8.p1 TRINITY_DN27884_c0_g1~~TRINITY_DN27884_c0_g1_i8.p1  ORF type:complete len:297 (+),score=23.51 TRINITY_DN27884_c0_g1_i8:21-911(+)